MNGQPCQFSWLAGIAVAVALHSSLAQACAQQVQTGEQRAVRFSQIDEVVDQWNANQHLYVCGDIGVSANQLGALEAWLDEHGPHWTVVLMQNAFDQSYHDPDGRSFSGMDAVEYALGHGLANRTRFGELEHTVTGETDGAAFVLFLQERKFSYYGSDAHDRRELGESEWVGELDRVAIRAMRDGGRILDAVKSTVTDINTRLNKQIEKEEAEVRAREAAVAREKIERARAIEDVKARALEIENSLIASIRDASTEFRRTHPSAATSNLALPPIDDWNAELKVLHDQLNESNARTSRQKLDQLRGKIDAYLDAYSIHKTFPQLIEPLRKRWDEITTFGRGLAIEASREAEVELANAQAAHSKGDMGFVQALERATLALERAEAIIFAEREKQAQSRARQRAVRGTLITTGGILGVLLLGLFWFLNRRRRPALVRAHEAFSVAQQMFDRQQSNASELAKRTQDTLGSRDSFAGRNFVGTTRELGLRVLERIDSLGKLVAQAKRFVEEAYRLLHPGNPVAEFANFISSSRYEYCINLLNSRAIVHPDPGERAPQAPAAQTLSEFIASSLAVTDSISRDLDRFSECARHVTAKAAELQAGIDNAAALESELAAAAKSDRYFSIPHFFSTLIPSVQADQDSAEGLAATDPVRACEEILAVGQRKLSEGRSVAQTIKQARKEVFPILDRCADRLRELGHRIGWIEKAVFALSDEANALFQKAIGQSVANEAAEFAASISRLSQQAENAARIAGEIAETYLPLVRGTGSRINTVRGEIATALRIEVEAALRETGHDPGTRLEAAEKQLAAARSALDYGNTDAATEALTIVQVETDRATQLVEASVEALHAFAGRTAEVNKLFDSVSAAALATENVVSQVEQRFEASAFNFRTDKSDLPQLPPDIPEEIAGTTVAARLAGAKQLMQDARIAVESSKALHNTGKLLEADNLIQLAGKELTASGWLLRQIDQHCLLLERLIQDNRQLVERIVTLCDQVRTSAADRRTSRTSLEQHGQIEATSREFAAILKKEGVKRDPIDDAGKLATLVEQVERLQVAIASDHQAHAETTRAVGGAKTQLAAAERLVQQSIDDGIPDSQAISVCQRAIAKLAQDLSQIEHRLNVAHDDWQLVSMEATRASGELGTAVGRLRNELRIAEDAVEHFTRASQEVYRAASWRGSYGIRVVGEPGAFQLDQARAALAKGDYAATAARAQEAENAAREAIDQAERAVERQRREQARRDEQQRRGSDFWTGFGGSSGGIFSGGSSSSSGWGGSWGSFGGSSGGSSSGSWGSSGSGSGFSRSGW